MRKLKASLIALTISSLFACSSVEIVHVPVGCLGQPVVNIKFTQEESAAIPQSAVDKIVLMRETYKARINAQCEINHNYDKLFKDAE